VNVSQGREESSGILFFNHEGTEAGGLIYGSKPTENGVSAGGSFTFDRMNQDQVVQIAYMEGTRGRVFSGMQVWDRPEHPHRRPAGGMRSSTGRASSPRRSSCAGRSR
jgi:hypothetical protein